MIKKKTFKKSISVFLVLCIIFSLSAISVSSVNACSGSLDSYRFTGYKQVNNLIVKDVDYNNNSVLISFTSSSAMLYNHQKYSISEFVISLNNMFENLKDCSKSIEVKNSREYVDKYGNHVWRDNNNYKCKILFAENRKRFQDGCSGYYYPPASFDFSKYKYVFSLSIKAHACVKGENYRCLESKPTYAEPSFGFLSESKRASLDDPSVLCISKPKDSKNSFTVSWKKSKDATGYEIYVTDITDIRNSTRKTYWYNSTDICTTRVIKGLKSGHKYIVSICAYVHNCYGKYMLDDNTLQFRRGSAFNSDGIIVI